MKKTWFITGASRGFGRIWAEAALERGDRVTATARKLADVADLAERFGDTVLPLALDVTDSAQVQPGGSAGIRTLRQAGRSCQQCRSQPARRRGGSQRRANPRLVRCELSRNGPGPPCCSASATATGKRTHSRCLQRPRNWDVAAHRLLLRHEMGSRSAPRIAGAGGQAVRPPRDDRRAGRLRHRFR